ncbi:MAG: glycosyltransferase family A protein [Eubacteriales bacterium]|nr:glycosyltransferase family A protein [Eubacteriales bacterium]
MKHTFAISAYGESPYLEQCIRSVREQSALDPVIICTSTPNELIRGLSEKYGLELYIRDGASSLKDDWNFAVQTAVEMTGAELVTVTHQDDVYHADYARALKKALKVYPDTSVFFTRYRTIDEAGNELRTKAESVKRLLRLPLRLRRISDREFIKRLPLIFGNGIGCPTCTYNISLTGLPVFQNDHSFVIDWRTLLRLSSMPGRFVCIEKELVDYRVHQNAETRKNIDNHNREKEEAEVFASIWPGPIVSLLMHFYKKAYRDYDADTD